MYFDTSILGLQAHFNTMCFSFAPKMAADTNHPYNTLKFSLKRLYVKNGTVKFFSSYRILISRIRCNFWQSLKNSVRGVQSHLKS